MQEEQVTTKIMDIAFKDEEELFISLQESFNLIGVDALFMSHYDLADRSGDSPIDWKKFLLDARVSAYIAEEIDMLKRNKVVSMLKDADVNKNTGQAQLLNTLLNQTKQDNKKEGPVFIYCYVPLNEEEQHAENVRMP